MSEREGSQRERGATGAVGLARAPGRLSEEWVEGEREGSQRERGATGAVGLARAPGRLSEEWA